MVSVFFFKQKTAYEMRISDWSSDVCSSDLHGERAGRHRADWVAEADGGGMSEEGVDQRARQEAVEDSESKRCAGIGRLKQALQRAGRALDAETQRGAVEAQEGAEELQADEDHEKAGEEGKAGRGQERGGGGAN